MSCPWVSLRSATTRRDADLGWQKALKVPQGVGGGLMPHCCLRQGRIVSEI